MSLYWPPEMGSWTWDGVSLVWPGGQPEDLEQSWSAAPIIIDNHEQPDVHGRLPRDAYIEQQDISVRFLLSALVMPNGSPAPNPAAAVAANYSHLVGIIGSPITWTESTVDTTVIRADGAVLTGKVQGSVAPLGAREGSVCRTTVSVVIPAGALDVDEGS